MIRLNNGFGSENQLITVRFLFCEDRYFYLSKNCEFVVEETCYVSPYARLD